MKEAGKQATELAKRLYQRQPTETPKPQGGISERVTAKLWQRMAELYGRQWEASYGVVGGSAFKSWADGLASMTPAQIKVGLDAVIAEGNEFPPNLIKFLRLCRQPSAPKYHREFPPELPPPDRNSDTWRRERDKAYADWGRINGWRPKL